jgi:membrane-associated PAP2 superfamily phosphatase
VVARVFATPVATITLTLSIQIIIIGIVSTATARSPPLALTAFGAVALAAA